MANTIPYWQKLQDPRWQRKRLEIMQRDQFKCAACDEAQQTLSVHHEYYVAGREPWEYPDWSLITLCADCHDMFQGLGQWQWLRAYGRDCGFNTTWESLISNLAQLKNLCVPLRVELDDEKHPLLSVCSSLGALDFFFTLCRVHYEVNGAEALSLFIAKMNLLDDDERAKWLKTLQADVDDLNRQHENREHVR